MFKLLTGLVFFTTLVFANTNVEVSVELSPAGSFQLKSNKIKGIVSKKGDTYTAKDIKVAIKLLSSDIELRDKHVREKLGYPKTKFVILEKAIAKQGKGKALLNVRGIKEKIDFTFKEIDKRWVEVNFSLSLKQFKYEKISYMGISVDDKIKVKAVLPLK